MSWVLGWICSKHRKHHKQGCLQRSKSDNGQWTLQHVVGYRNAYFRQMPASIISKPQILYTWLGYIKIYISAVHVFESQQWIGKSWSNNNAESYNHVLKYKTQWRQMKCGTDLIECPRSGGRPAKGLETRPTRWWKLHISEPVHSPPRVIQCLPQHDQRASSGVVHPLPVWLRQAQTYDNSSSICQKPLCSQHHEGCEEAGATQTNDHKPHVQQQTYIS